nr:DUF4968 domain-containing protein [Lachnospiraceae bacterium]
MIIAESNRLTYRYDAETLYIESWGENAVRVRATKCAQMPEENWALSIPQSPCGTVKCDENGGVLENGKIVVRLSEAGKITIFTKDGKKLLEEYTRNRRDVTDPKCSAIEVEGREFKPLIGGDYHLTVRFESLDPEE